MRSGGKLTIEATNSRVDEVYASVAEIERGQYVCISCTDTGTGMTQEVLNKAFDPFYSTKEVGSGTGLGLSMAHGFVRQSNGHIKLYSELGEGTVVKMYLSRVHGSEPNHRDKNVNLVDPNASGTRILVVEDDVQFRETVKAQLLTANYNVQVAIDGRGALKALETDGEFDLLLTDVVLPGGMNGREIADQAKVLQPNIRVIFMSGYSENSIIHHGRLDKGVTLIQKPFRKMDLVREIIRAMRKV